MKYGIDQMNENNRVLNYMMMFFGEKVIGCRMVVETENIPLTDKGFFFEEYCEFDDPEDITVRVKRNLIEEYICMWEEQIIPDLDAKDYWAELIFDDNRSIPVHA